MKVLLTGATGFLGKYIIKELVENNYEVICIGRNDKIGKEILEEYKNDKVQFVKADFTNKDNFFEKINDSINKMQNNNEKMLTLIHCGGLSSVWGSWEDFYNTNVKGTENVLELCAKQKIQKLIFISSPSIYAQEKNQINIKEEEAPLKNNLNFYIKSKLMAEKKIKEYNVPYVIIRPRGLFGVGDTSIIPRLLELNDKIGIPLFSNGEQLVDITCVENVAYGIRLALENDNSIGQIYNITNDEPMKFKDLLLLFFNEMKKEAKFKKRNYKIIKFFVKIVEKIYTILKIKKEPRITLYTLYLMKYSQTLCIDKIKKELGYKPKMTIAEGIKKYVRESK